MKKYMIILTDASGVFGCELQAEASAMFDVITKLIGAYRNQQTVDNQQMQTYSQRMQMA